MNLNSQNIGPYSLNGMSHGMCSYIYMCINTVVKNVMLLLYLW
jgi:hypothetical protein